MNAAITTSSPRLGTTNPAPGAGPRGEVLRRPAQAGIVLHEADDLRITLLAQPQAGIATYDSPRFRTTHQIASPAARTLAMVLDIRADVSSAVFNGLLIEIDDGTRVREHVPTAFLATADGFMILDVHPDFGSAFMACCINEVAARALGCSTDTIEETQIAKPAVLAMARDVAAAHDVRFSDRDLAHAVNNVARAEKGRKAPASLASRVASMGPDRERGRAKVLAMVARGELAMRRTPRRASAG